MIYTFYSYKGGVGRSMALANVAEWFYEQGLRVVMIDWDLEAPGLESFFVSGDEIEKVRAKPGLIDMLLAYEDQYPLLSMTVPASAAMAAGANGGSVAEEAIKPADHAEPNANTFLWAVSGTSRLGAGVIDLNETQKPPERLDTPSAVAELEKHLPPIEYFLYPLRPPQINLQGKHQALWLLSAGWRTKE